MSRLPASALPTLRQLQFLNALKTHGSFVRAAEAVGVTQPTLSAGIKELEIAIGAQLVDRSSAHAILTAAGETAADSAAEILGAVEGLVNAARGAAEPLTGLFRLGAIPTIAPFVLPRALPALREAYPNLKLYLREDLTSRLVDSLRARALDAAIIALPYEAPGLECAPILEDEFLFVGPRGHRLDAQTNLSLEDLAQEDVLLLEDGHCLREHALSVCQPRAGSNSGEFGATSLHTLVQMVAGGLGVSLLPRLASEGGIASGAAVTVRAFAEPVIGRTIGMAWRKGSPRGADAKRIGEAIGRALRKPL